MKFNLRSAFSIAIASGLTLALSACGGGDSGPGYSPAEGFYQGSLSNTGFSSIQMIVLEDDSFWSVYGVMTGLGLQPRGFVQGQGSSYDGSFISNNMRDFSDHRVADASVSATYGGGSIGGTWNYPDTTLGFSAAAPSVSAYDYFRPANPNAVLGGWSLTTFTGSSLIFNVYSGGAISSAAGACAFTGAMTPRASGINVFDLSLTFNSGVCDLPIGQTIRGVAVTSPLSGGSSQLVLAGVDSSRLYGMAAVGSR